MKLTPGMSLEGYCNGYFGRDSYGTKLVIATGAWNRQNWMVVDEGGYLNFASGFTDEDVSNWLDDIDN